VDWGVWGLGVCVGGGGQGVLISGHLLCCGSQKSTNSRIVNFRNILELTILVLAILELAIPELANLELANLELAILELAST
jgi:hypothetical protein